MSLSSSPSSPSGEIPTQDYLFYALDRSYSLPSRYDGIPRDTDHNTDFSNLKGKTEAQKLVLRSLSLKLETKALGTGATSLVFKAFTKSMNNRSDTNVHGTGGRVIGEPVAIKLFKVFYTLASNTQEMVYREINILKLLSKDNMQHPNIIKLIDVVMTPEAVSNCVKQNRMGDGQCGIRNLPIKGLVMEYCDSGDLLKYIPVGGALPLPVEFCQAVFVQVVRAVQYLHSKGIIHSDIKPENILFKSNGLVVLTDFGFAQKVKTDDRPIVKKEKLFRVASEEKEQEQGYFIGQENEPGGEGHSASSTSLLTKKESSGSDLSHLAPGNKIGLESGLRKQGLIGSMAHLPTKSSFTGSQSSVNENLHLSSASRRLVRPLQSITKLAPLSVLGSTNAAMTKSKSLSALQKLRQKQGAPKLLVTSSGGTAKYKAPETLFELDNRLNEDKVETEKRTPFDGAAADIWSLGVVLHVMLEGRLPVLSPAARQASVLQISASPGPSPNSQHSQAIRRSVAYSMADSRSRQDALFGPPATGFDSWGHSFQAQGQAMATKNSSPTSAVHPSLPDSPKGRDRVSSAGFSAQVSLSPRLQGLEIVKQMMVIDPEHRLNIREIGESSWVRSMRVTGAAKTVADFLRKKNPQRRRV